MHEKSSEIGQAIIYPTNPKVESEITLTEPTLLIVENHPSLRKALLTRLSMLYPNWHYLEADNERDALMLVRQTKIDLILIDIGLRLVGERDDISQIKQESPGSILILLTLQEMPDNQNWQLEMEADAYLIKERVYRELVPTIERLLRKRIEGRE